jgi:hypothetical protein
MKALISHEEESFDIIQDVVSRSKHNFKFIVELGTFYYGLTLLLHEAAPKLPLFTFDLMDPRTSLSRAKRRLTREDLDYIYNWGFGKRVNFVRGDVVDRKNIMLVSLLERPERKLFYCDNGNKNREVCYYGKLLAPEDVMGVHDWRTEVDPEVEGVKEVLEMFREHPVNEDLRNKNCLTRFFIKER